MLANSDRYGRIKCRLFRSYFDFSLNGYLAQGRSGIGPIWWPNGKFQQVNGLGVAVAPAFQALEHQPANFVGEAFFELVVPNQEAHVDRPIERVEDEVQIAVGGEFPAVDSALQSFICLFASRP